MVLKLGTHPNPKARAPTLCKYASHRKAASASRRLRTRMSRYKCSIVKPRLLKEHSTLRRFKRHLTLRPYSHPMVPSNTPCSSLSCATQTPFHPISKPYRRLSQRACNHSSNIINMHRLICWERGVVGRSRPQSMARIKPVAVPTLRTWALCSSTHRCSPSQHELPLIAQ